MNLHYSLEQLRFLQLLVNIFEDSRIDAWLLQRYPGLRRAWIAVTRIARSVRGAAVLRSQETNLLWAVQDVANGWRTTAFVGGKYAFVWGKIQRILEARREQTLASAADAILTAVLVHEVLSPVFSMTSLEDAGGDPVEEM